ncbi:hypothetical protein ACHAPJ_012566 [Fusarium lateritium]
MTSQNTVASTLPADGLSIVQGPTNIPLWEKTLGQLIVEQAKERGSRTALVVPWQNVRLTYDDLAHRSSLIAKALLDAGLRYGDSIGIFAGNCHQYIELFLGAARIGCPFVVLNTTSSPHELSSVVARSERLILLDPAAHRPAQPVVECEQYAEFSIRGTSIFMNDAKLRQAQRKVRPGDVLNMQFTSGTTGLPKASMLTHNNLINDGRYVGMAMRLTEQDVICCPPPLFHCFGLVMGFLASFTHGSTVVFPSDRFNAKETIDAVIAEKATALLGVPTMFVAELEELESTSRQITTVRTGLVSGSPVSPSLMEDLKGKMNIQGMLIAYGMTETSPVTFIASLEDPDERLLTSLGRVLPHTAAKVVDQAGKVVPFGTRGEICTSGFALQKGYFRDVDKTNEAMRKDDDGVLWMHTGDEGYLDEEGYGFITGRIKDLIIRGGENLSPSEIENQLLRHPAINEACVVGARDRRHGEVVVAFLKVATGATRISDQEIEAWVKKDLGSVKVPAFTFWVGQDGINTEVPKTGSGKYQKHLIRELANRLVEEVRAPRARL